MTKVEELEKAVLMLEEQVQMNKVMSETYQEDLTKAKKDLADINKPELTASQLDNIDDAIEKAVNEYDFSDTDNYDIEYGIDYDCKVHCESLELCNHTDLVEMIVKEVSKLFVEAKELDTTETDNHA
jgi:hypothetical protein